MPVPKRKTSKSRRDKRSSCKFIRPKAVTQCSNCNAALSPHQACMTCGFYKGKKVLNTKLDRALKRGEIRKKYEEKYRQKMQQEQNLEKESNQE